MIPLEAIPGFDSWGKHLETLLAQGEPLWVYGPQGSGVSHTIRELSQRRASAFLDDADQVAPELLVDWLKAHPRGVLGAHGIPGSAASPASHRCLPLRLWSLEEAPGSLIPCLEALGRDLGVPPPLPTALGLLPCPGNLLELHNRVLRWKLLGQAPEPESIHQLPLEADSLAANLHILERTLLHRALRRSYGNRTEAAQRLGVSRRQLYFLIDRHGDPVRGSLPVAPPLKRLKKHPG